MEEVESSGNRYTENENHGGIQLDGNFSYWNGKHKIEIIKALVVFLSVMVGLGVGLGVGLASKLARSEDSAASVQHPPSPCDKVTEAIETI